MLLRGSPTPYLWSVWTYAACASTPGGDAPCCWSCHLPMTAAKFQKLLRSRPSYPHVSRNWAFPFPEPEEGEKVPQHSKMPHPPPRPRLHAHQGTPKRGWGGKGPQARLLLPLASSAPSYMRGGGRSEGRNESSSAVEGTRHPQQLESARRRRPPAPSRSSGPRARDRKEAGSRAPEPEGPTPALAPREDCVGPSSTR